MFLGRYITNRFGKMRERERERESDKRWGLLLFSEWRLMHCGAAAT